MSLARLALANSRVTVIAVAAIVVWGVLTFLSYPSAEDPTITIRNAALTAFRDGMSAVQVEGLITEPIETAMREIAEIDEITSTSKDGQSLVQVTIYDWVDDLDAVFQDIRNKAGDLRGRMPSDTRGPFVNDEQGLVAIATVALWADGFALEEMRDVALDVRDRLYTLDGIRKVELYGVQEERIYLEVSPARLAQFGVPPSEIFRHLAQQNIVEPGGAIRVGPRSVVLQPSGNLETIDEIGAILFAIPGTDQVARLDSIAEITRTTVDPPDKPVFFNGRPAIILSVSTLEGTNNVAFGRRLTALLDDAEQDLMIGYVLDYATFQPDLISVAVDGAISNVYQTLTIVLVVVMVFLGLRTGLIVGAFVPLTMLLGIVVMRQLDIELQRMSIAAMIIALGLLVDNGIVVAEDIRVRMERGVDRFEAAIRAGRTLAIPLLTSTLTTIFAFVPMLLLDGGPGDYVRSLSQVVTILLLGSWLLSMTVTPVICAWFMKVEVGAPEEVTGTVVHRGYLRLLRSIQRWRWVFVAGLVTLLAGAIMVLGLLRTEFFPLGDRNQFLVFLDFEAGTDVRTTEAQTRTLAAWLADPAANREVVSNVAYVAHGGPRFFLSLSPVDPDPHRAFLVVNTADPKDVPAVAARVNAFVDAELPDARSDAKQMWFGSSEPGLLQLHFSGPDGLRLMEIGAAIEGALRGVPGTIGIKNDWENRILKLVVDVDQARARRAGVTSEDVATALEATFVGAAISEFRDGDESIPIVIRGEAELQSSLDALGRVQVYSSGVNGFVQLAQVATIRPEWQFSQVRRRDQERTLTVEARSATLPAPALLAAIQPALDALDLGRGYRIEIGGEIADQADANASLFSLLPVAFAGIVLLLVGQFNSVRRGAIILLTIPLILIGAVLGLVVMNAPYGFMVMLGLFSLAGIVINNGIVLIDRIEAERAKGLDVDEAVEAACLARLRPILMTTLTTVLGLVPLILFGGALFYGMASAMAFGLVVATILTLGFVPVLYRLFITLSYKNRSAAAAA